jgi:hypothetical protein
MRHHPCGMVLQDVAVVHPAAGPIVRQPRDAHAPECRHVHGVFPGEETGRRAVHFQYLEEEAVQVEGASANRASLRGDISYQPDSSSRR